MGKNYKVGSDKQETCQIEPKTFLSTKDLKKLALSGTNIEKAFRDGTEQSTSLKDMMLDLTKEDEWIEGFIFYFNRRPRTNQLAHKWKNFLETDLADNFESQVSWTILKAIRTIEQTNKESKLPLEISLKDFIGYCHRALDFNLRREGKKTVSKKKTSDGYEKVKIVSIYSPVVNSQDCKDTYSDIIPSHTDTEQVHDLKEFVSLFPLVFQGLYDKEAKRKVQKIVGVEGGMAGYAALKTHITGTRGQELMSFIKFVELYGDEFFYGVNLKISESKKKTDLKNITNIEELKRIKYLSNLINLRKIGKSSGEIYSPSQLKPKMDYILQQDFYIAFRKFIDASEYLKLINSNSEAEAINALFQGGVENNNRDLYCKIA